MHNCAACKGRQLELTEAEAEMLNRFSQFSFLPVARKIDDENPIYLEEKEHTIEEYGIILTLLEKKGLIDIDYEKPLLGADLSAYAPYPIVGSMALTARGLQVLELLDLQGFTQ